MGKKREQIWLKTIYIPAAVSARPVGRQSFMAASTKAGGSGKAQSLLRFKWQQKGYRIGNSFEKMRRFRGMLVEAKLEAAALAKME
jgi:hypothetical protein